MRQALAGLAPMEEKRSNLAERRRHRLWPVFAALTVLTLGLGLWGFGLYFAAAGTPRPLSDLLYLALQLFTLESGAVAGPLPWPLQAARFLAPALAASAAILALLALFGEQARRLRLRFRRGHVVVCGLGRKGALFVSRFLEQGHRVAAVEVDPANPNIAACREAGAVVLVGDARARDVLLRAGLRRAKTMVSVCREDDANAEAALQAMEICRSRRRGALAAHVHIVDPLTCNLLRDRALSARCPDSFELDFFNVYDAAARELLDQYASFLEVDPEPGASPVLAVLGFGFLGRSLAVQAARRWQDRFRRTGTPLALIVVDREAGEKAESLALRFPRLGEICRVIPRTINVRGPRLQDPGLLVDEATGRAARGVFVCFDDPSIGYYSALTLAQSPAAPDAPIIVRTDRDSGLAAMIGGGNGRVGGFPWLERTCRPETVRGGLIDLIARALHEAYLKNETGAAEDAGSNPSLVPWDDLPEALRISNRRHAHHLRAKLDAVGCGLAWLTDWDADLFRFAPEEVERLARLEHERWILDYEARGWKLKPGPKDAARKTHPDLVGWEELPEKIRDKDRAFIREMPRVLAAVDLQIVRRKPG